jgi:hypothetical protein
MSLYRSGWEGAGWQIVVIIAKAFTDVEDLLVVVYWET